MCVFVNCRQRFWLDAKERVGVCVCLCVRYNSRLRGELDKVLIHLIRGASSSFIDLPSSTFICFSLGVIEVKVTEIITRFMSFYVLMCIRSTDPSLCVCVPVVSLVTEGEQNDGIDRFLPCLRFVDVRSSFISLPIRWLQNDDDDRGASNTPLAAGSINWWIQQQQQVLKEVRCGRPKKKLRLSSCLVE